MDNDLHAMHQNAFSALTAEQDGKVQNKLDALEKMENSSKRLTEALYSLNDELQTKAQSVMDDPGNQDILF